MKEFIIEYIVISKRIARVEAEDRETAVREVKEWHAQLNYDKVNVESVLIQKVDEDE